MRPARKISNNSPHKIIGRFPSRKSPFMIWWESQHERDCLYHLDMDPTIERIVGQPFRVNYVLDGKRRRYTPDFMVEGPSRRDVIEVKPSERTKGPDFPRWKAAVAAVLARHNYRFIVMTEEDYRQEPGLENRKWLHCHLLPTGSVLDIHRLLMQVPRGAQSIESVQKTATALGIAPQLVWHLLATGVFTVDLNLPLTPQSRITLQRNPS